MLMDKEQLDYDGMPIPEKLTVYAIEELPTDENKILRRVSSRVIRESNLIPAVFVSGFRKSKGKKVSIGTLGNIVGSKYDWWDNPSYKTKEVEISNKDLRIGIPLLNNKQDLEDIKYMWPSSFSGSSSNYFSVVRITSPEIEQLFPEKQVIIGLCSSDFNTLIYSQMAMKDGWFPLRYTFCEVRDYPCCIMRPIVTDIHCPVQNKLREYASELENGKIAKTLIPGHLYIRKDSKLRLFLYLGNFSNILVQTPYRGRLDVSLANWNDTYYTFSHRKLSGDIFLEYDWDDGFGTKAILDMEKNRLNLIEFFRTYLIETKTNSIWSKLSLNSTGNYVDLGEILEYEEEPGDIEDIVKSMVESQLLSLAGEDKCSIGENQWINTWKRSDLITWNPECIDKNPDLKSMYLYQVNKFIFQKFTADPSRMAKVYAHLGKQILNERYDNSFIVIATNYLLRCYGESLLYDFTKNLIVTLSEKEREDLVNKTREIAVNYVDKLRQDIASK